MEEKENLSKADKINLVKGAVQKLSKEFGMPAAVMMLDGNKVDISSVGDKQKIAMILYGLIKGDADIARSLNDYIELENQGRMKFMKVSDNSNLN